MRELRKPVCQLHKKRQFSTTKCNYDYLLEAVLSQDASLLLTTNNDGYMITDNYRAITYIL